MAFLESPVLPTGHHRTESSDPKPLYEPTPEPLPVTPGKEQLAMVAASLRRERAMIEEKQEQLQRTHSCNGADARHVKEPWFAIVTTWLGSVFCPSVQ